MSDKFGYYKEKYCKNNKRTTNEVQYIYPFCTYMWRGVTKRVRILTYTCPD